MRETPTTLLVDGHWGFGQIAAAWAMTRIVEKARVSSIAAAGIHNCGHIGRVGVYPAMAAEQGCVGLAFANGGGTQPRVAPHGAARPVFGTNPLAAAIPVPGSEPIVVDFSTAVVAAGKIRVLRDKGEELPEGWILDRTGAPSRRPRDYYDGGMLLTAAGHKGYGLSLLVEVLAGLLTGAGAPALPASGYRVGNGVLFVAIDVAAFRDPARFGDEVRDLTRVIKGSPAVAGGGKVLLPGEPEQLERARRLAEGLELPEATWRTILDVAASVGVAV